MAVGLNALTPKHPGNALGSLETFITAKALAENHEERDHTDHQLEGRLGREVSCWFSSRFSLSQLGALHSPVPGSLGSESERGDMPGFFPTAPPLLSPWLLLPSLASLGLSPQRGSPSPRLPSQGTGTSCTSKQLSGLPVGSALPWTRRCSIPDPRPITP